MGVLNVPNLRFGEYSDEWNLTELQKVATISKGSGISKDQLSENGTYCILYGELYTKYNSEIISEVYSKTELDAANLVKSKENDVIIPCSGETAIDISTARCVPFNGILLGGDLNIIRLKNQNGGFFAYQLNGKRKVDIAKVAQGVSVVHLYGEHLKRVKIAYPTYSEQKKIADFLSLLDSRIATQNKIIEDLKKLKVAISQVCFEQKPIDEIPLHKFFKKGKAGGTPTSTNKEYYDGEIPFLSINDITEQGKYIYSTEKHLSEKGLLNSSAWVVPVNSLILSMYASVGLTTINKIPLATSQAMFSMELKEPELIDYLYYYLTYFKYRYIHRYLETGTQSNINADIVRSIKIPNYGKSKNIEMSAMLANIDKKIEIENIYIQSLLSQKAYLLSNMFI